MKREAEEEEKTSGKIYKKRGEEDRWEEKWCKERRGRNKEDGR